MAINDAEVLRLITPASDRRRLGGSLWLLLYLLSCRDRTDSLVRSDGSVRASDLGPALGIGERQVRRDLQRLRRAGLVELRNTGRGYEIRIKAQRGRL